MKIKLSILSAILLCVGLAIVTAQSTKAPDYLTSAAALYRMAQNPNSNDMRQHAWQILSDELDRSCRPDTPPGCPVDLDRAININGPDPKWERSPWLGKCAMELTNSSYCPSDSQATGSLLPDVLLAPAQNSVLKGQPGIDADPGNNKFQFSAVLYNPAAQIFIKGDKKITGSKDFSLRSTWINELGKDPGMTDPKGPELIVKEMWELVLGCDSGTTCPPQAIHTWDRAEAAFKKFPPKSDAPHVTLGTPTAWHDKTYVLPDPSVKCDKSNYSSDDSASEQSPIPLSCFHYIAFAARKGPQTVPVGPDQDPVVAQVPSYYILVGFHIVSGEVPDWTWSTFWWTGNPSAVKAKDKPKALKDPRDPWRFYSMNTFINPNPGKAFTTPHSPMIFNPYIEGPDPDGQFSNCLYCHSHATFRYNKAVAKQEWITPDLKTMEIPKDQETSTFSSQGAVQTHFLWSIATSLDSTFDGTSVIIAKRQPPSPSPVRSTPAPQSVKAKAKQ